MTFTVRNDSVDESESLSAIGEQLVQKSLEEVTQELIRTWALRDGANGLRDFDHVILNKANASAEDEICFDNLKIT